MNHLPHCPIQADQSESLLLLELCLVARASKTNPAASYYAAQYLAELLLKPVWKHRGN